MDAHKNISSRAPESSKSDTNLDLESGTLLVDVPTLKRESKFEVKTPLGIAGVRGTRFYVNAKKAAQATGFRNKKWQRLRDSNPCTSLERAVS